MQILLVDANNLAYRNYYAQNLKTTSGQNTGMIYGFINSMLTAVREVPNDIVLYVWDPPGGSVYRKNLYPMYKGNRQSQSPEFHEEMGLLKELLSALGCAQITKDGVETDDIIGYLSQVHYKDHRVVSMTNDKDILQTMSDRVTVYHPVNGLLQMTADGLIPIKEQSKVIWLKPSQVPDYKALVGDPSDNYPGIPGFGIGAAITYFAYNEGVQGLIDGTANISSLRSNVLSNVLAHRGMVPLWKQLATLNLEEGKVAVPPRSPKVPEIVNTLFDQLEFKQFKVLGDALYRIGGI